MRSLPNGRLTRSGIGDALLSAGIGGYEYDTFFRDHRLTLVYGRIIPVMAVGSFDVSSERAMALWSTVIDRARTAGVDLEAKHIIL